jgi:hypothetical protein
MEMNDYMTIREAAEAWDVSERWVQALCADGKIEGAMKFGHSWAIPNNTERPADYRVKTGKYKGWRKKLNSTRENSDK